MRVIMRVIMRFAAATWKNSASGIANSLTARQKRFLSVRSVLYKSLGESSFII